LLSGLPLLLAIRLPLLRLSGLPLLLAIRLPLLRLSGLPLLLPIRLSLLRLSRLPLLLAGGLVLAARWLWLLRMLIGPGLLARVVLFWMVLILAIGWPVLRCARKSDRSEKQRQNGCASDP
jgi:hypothetical protein